MAASLCYFSFLLMLCFLPCISFACPKEPNCGSIAIQAPFFTDTSHPNCRGIYMIHCNNSTATIQFNKQGQTYTVLAIDYRDNILIVQDPKLSQYFQRSNCSFLYEFIYPIPRFNLSLPYNSFFNCKREDYNFSHDCFSEIYNSTVCKDYNLYYSYISNHQTPRKFSPDCLAPYPTLFEWELSFNKNELSLISASYSENSYPKPDCFNQQKSGDDCSNTGASGHSKSMGHSIAKRKIKIGVMVGIGGLLLALLFLFCFQCHRRKFGNAIFFVKMETKSARAIKAFLEKHGSLAPKTYTYSEVKKITKSFNDKLGQGGYGTVFKGKLDNGREVAVKMLSESKGNGEEFINEIASIGKTSHVNVVTLLGFCLEGSKRALIYDFMPNGSLEKYIYSEKSNTTRPLGWETLYKITVGIARGLEYLHRGCNARIVHFDIKPHNILLDEDFCPKISDFGLAKLCSGKDSILSIDGGARGTIGYIAPEVFSRNFGVVSSKSDVYSYGMMVLEMAGGRKNINATVDQSSEIYFPHWIYEHLDRHGTLQKWELSREIEEIARKMIFVGLWCIQTVPENRPSMNKVVDMLQGSITELQMPPKPYLSSPLGFTIGSLAISAT